jgi:hypothetical protein
MALARATPAARAQRLRALRVAGVSLRTRWEREHDPVLLRGFRAITRWILLNRPLSIMVSAGALVAIPFLLDFIPGASAELKTFSERHGTASRLLEHLVVAGLVAAVAYYWLLGLKRQRALKSYRERVSKAKDGLVDWYTGGTPELRERSSERLGEEIIHSREPAVVIVKGREGSGRTSFIVELVKYLAAKGLIPVPILVRRGGDFDLDSLAKAKFCRSLEPVISSREQADAIWHFACQTRAVVVLVDGLDKEVLKELKRDRDKGANAINTLHENRVSVVLATTLDLVSELDIDTELGLDTKPSVVREDLDRFTYSEATSYLERTLRSNDRVGEARAALNKLHDPADDSLVAPYYLNLIARLTTAGVPLDFLPQQADRWRVAILGKYLEEIENGQVLPARNRSNPDRVRRHPGREVCDLAARVAQGLDLQSNLAVERGRLGNIDREVLDDAEELNLLRAGTKSKSFSFTSDDLGAYLVASREAEPERLLQDVTHVLKDEVRSARHDRYILTTFTFWLLKHEGPVGRNAFERFLADVETCSCTRPRVAATAVRILAAWEDPRELTAPVVAIAQECIAAVDRDAGWPDHASDSTGPIRLVRALGKWDDPQSRRLLWSLATSRYLEVEWPALKALASTAQQTIVDLADDIEEVLTRAEGSDLEDLSEEGSKLGNELASLAWLLPTLRFPSTASNDEIECLWRRVKERCLSDGMSPLRGEMAVAQGLKLAIVNGRSENFADVKELLCGSRPLRFWHARLVLVHALLAHAWKHPARELRAKLIEVMVTETHPLTRRAIELALRGLRDQAAPWSGADMNRMYEYMWSHEHDAVTRVEQSKWRASRLATDVVLLSNMTYRLWKRDGTDAGCSACFAELPSCIRDGSKRGRIMNGDEGACTCEACLCANPKPLAVDGTWARFSAGFCREQARLAMQYGRPAWTRKGMFPFREHSHLEKYWREQADEIRPSKNGARQPVAAR